ncbi:MAG: hypothetical protein OSB05_10915 [Akkermansiaceae bacterium]|nr:hypothetical protein [Akkermansiaceae bacterium]
MTDLRQRKPSQSNRGQSRSLCDVNRFDEETLDHLDSPATITVRPNLPLLLASPAK